MKAIAVKRIHIEYNDQTHSIHDPHIECTEDDELNKTERENVLIHGNFLMYQTSTNTTVIIPFHNIFTIRLTPQYEKNI